MAESKPNRNFIIKILNFEISDQRGLAIVLILLVIKLLFGDQASGP